MSASLESIPTSLGEITPHFFWRTSPLPLEIHRMLVELTSNPNTPSHFRGSHMTQVWPAGTSPEQSDQLKGGHVTQLKPMRLNSGTFAEHVWCHWPPFFFFFFFPILSWRTHMRMSYYRRKQRDREVEKSSWNGSVM